MKFRFVKIASVALAVAVSVGVLGACKNDRTPADEYARDPSGKTYNNEEDALVFSTLEVDRVFNPFFSTSATDSSVVGLTQIGMLSNDEKGNYVYGDDEEVVTKDLEIKTTGEGEAQTTEYKFVLKNNVRFSDGSYLTMKDVLFNMYVYLDSAYTGSTTMYSTDIVGLKEYRTQASSEEEQDSFMDQFNIEASTRINALTEAADYIFNDSGYDDAEDNFETYLKEYQDSNGDAYQHIVEDYAKALEYFREELNTDWTNSLNAYESTILVDDKGVEHKWEFNEDGSVKTVGPFTTNIEQFFYNEGVITWDKKANGGDGELRCSYGSLEDVKNIVKPQWNDKEKRYETDIEAAAREKQTAIDFVYNTNIPTKIAEIINYWVTADNLFTYLANDAMEQWYKDNPIRFPNISGIKFLNKDTSCEVNGVTYSKPTYETDAQFGEHVTSGNEVLSITIHKIDPKAIWNFSFGVAPMSYYSNEEQIAAFDYESHFGVEQGSQTFLQNVVNSSEKVGLPKGAGPYMAAKASGGEATDKDEFYSNNVIYYERNPYYVMGPAIVKKVRYQVIPSNQMVNSLVSKTVTFSEPNAKPEIKTQLDAERSRGFTYQEVPTLGYGYIGINAGKVPSLEARQIIMHCINTQECVEYYGGDAYNVYRSMSRESWAYPKDSTAYYPYIAGPVPDNFDAIIESGDHIGEYAISEDYVKFAIQKGKKAGDTFTAAEQWEFIKGLLERANYSGAENSKHDGSNGDAWKDTSGNTLKYTFTVVGETSDHPAWNALYHAAQLLNKWGFDINVTTDVAGLSKLATGSLTVWAAAWGATIDPDMYQVYHKDSTASSVLNWGYRQIKQNTGEKYRRELAILNQLSTHIEEARETEVQSRRAAIYEDALLEVMQLAVELPTYQRSDLFAYDRWKLDESTLTPDEQLSAFRGLTTRMYEISLVS